MPCDQCLLYYRNPVPLGPVGSLSYWGGFWDFGLSYTELANKGRNHPRPFMNMGFWDSGTVINKK